MVVVRTGGDGEGRLIFNGYGVSVWEGGKNAGDGWW